MLRMLRQLTCSYSCVLIYWIKSNANGINCSSNFKVRLLWNKKVKSQVDTKLSQTWSFKTDKRVFFLNSVEGNSNGK